MSRRRWRCSWIRRRSWWWSRCRRRWPLPWYIRGNFACGIKEQIIFPEIDFEKVDAVRGMDVCFVTTAKTDEEGKELLKALGAPFAENN